MTGKALYGLTGRRFGEMSQGLWQVWSTLRGRGGEDRQLAEKLWHVRHEIEVLRAALVELSHGGLHCHYHDCEAEPTHSLLRLGFKGEQDIVEFSCSEHLPGKEHQWMFADVLPLFTDEEAARFDEMKRLLEATRDV